MKLKALLLGSAAALIAVSGARAADAVVAEPEPVEYVKVCDMYGAGFFYIPGTENCLRISGQVRVQYEYDANGGDDDFSNAEASTSNWGVRARVQLDARNETDYGTLRSWIRLEGTNNGNAANRTPANAALIAANGIASSKGGVNLTQAYISLAGFTVGYSDLHWATFHGYGNLTDNYAGYYGFQSGMFAQYEHSANGFTGVIGVQDVDNNNNAHVNLDYYVGAKYAASWGEIAGTYIYEDVADEGAFKVSAVVMPVEGLSIKGWYAADEGGNTIAVQGAGDYAWGVSASYAATDTVTVAVGYTDRDNTVATAEHDYITVGAYWTPVPGLAVNAEVQITDDDNAYSLRVYRSF